MCKGDYKRKTYHKPDEDKAQKIFESLKGAREKKDYALAQQALWKIVDEVSVQFSQLSIFNDPSAALRPLRQLAKTYMGAHAVRGNREHEENSSRCVSDKINDNVTSVLIPLLGFSPNYASSVGRKSWTS